MLNIQLIELFQGNPVISAVSDLKLLKEALKSPSGIIFMLTGDIMNLQGVVKKCREYNKVVFLHLDLIKGFSRDIESLKFIKEYINPDGVISTKTTLLKNARHEGLFIIQRLFMLDSSSLGISIKSAQELRPDAVEIMPGIMPKIIKKTCENLHVPVIAGGLIEDKHEVITALEAGATSISTSRVDLWYE